MNIQPAKINNSLKNRIVFFTVSIIALLGIYVVIDVCCDRKNARLEMEEICKQQNERKNMFEQVGLFSDGDVPKSMLSDTDTEYEDGDDEGSNSEDDDPMIDTAFEIACKGLVIDARRQHQYFLLVKKFPRQLGADAWGNIRNEASTSIEKCKEAIRLNAPNSEDLRASIKLLQEIIRFVDNISRPIGRASPKYAYRTANKRNSYELL